MSVQSRALTRPTFSRRVPYLMGTLVRTPLVLALYVLAIFSVFAFLIGVIDVFRLGPDTPSVWPELQSLVGAIPGGLLFMAPLMIVAAILAARGLDHAFDSLHPR